MPEHNARKPGRGPQGSGDGQDPFFSQLSKAGLVRDADACKLVWARVKGYPWWPAQVLSKQAAKVHLSSVTHKSRSDAPVIFFGTSEIAWIGSKDVTDWGSGMEQSFHSKGRKNKKFVVALEQVRDFLSLTQERVAPPNWWCAPPARGASPVSEEPPSSDEAEEVPQLKRPPSAAAAGAIAAASVQQSAAQAQQEQLLDTHSAQQRQGSFASGDGARDFAPGAGRYAAAAVAAATAATMSAEDAEELQQAAAAEAAAVAFTRERSSGKQQLQHRHSNGRVDDSAPQHSSRSAGTHKSVCQQIWGSGGGGVSQHPSSDAAADLQSLGRQQRKRRATRQLYQGGSEATDSDGSDNAAVAGRPRSAGTGPSSRQRTGSASRSRGTSAVAAAAAAAAAAVAAEEADAEEALLDDEGEQAIGFMASKRRRLLQAEGEAAASDSDATDLESLAMAAMAMAQLANSGGGAGGSGGGSWQPAEQQQVAAVKAEAGGMAGAAAADSDEAEVAALSQVVGYEHGGAGLPCAHSWQYAVSMPGCGAPSKSAACVGAAGSSSASSAGKEQPAAEPAAVEDEPAADAAAAAVPAAAAAPCSAYYVQMFTGWACAGASAADESEGQQQGSGEESTEQQQEAAAVEGLVAVAEAAAVADMGSDAVAGLAGLAALAAAPAAATAVGYDAAAAAAVGVVPGAAVDQAGAAVSQLRRAELAKHVAAANAAISAAFTASAPAAAAGMVGGHLRQGGHHHHHHHHQHHHSMHNSSSAVVSERSAGSGGQRMGASGGSSFSSKRRSAAAAAAMAAAHVITPSNPQLDRQVLELLMNPAGPRLPLQQGLPDVGFTLPRELLLNRPPKFEMLRRNVFVSRERPKRLAKNEVQVCNCRPRRVRQADGSDLLVGCTGGCLNRLSYIHCDPRTCPCGAACTNKPFHQLRHPALEVFLTENRGHGVRSTQQLDKGQFVVEYAGEVIDQAELQRRMDAARDSGEQHFYIMELAPGLYIDAKKKGNNARLLNSSCDPNCETQKWRDAATGEIRIGIFTTRSVRENEELTYDYMFEHSGVGALARGFKCMCGAANCRGTMDVNPERKRDWGRRVDVWWEGDGVYYRGTVTGFSTSTGKHTIMYDDGDVERVVLTEVPHLWVDEVVHMDVADAALIADGDAAADWPEAGEDAGAAAAGPITIGLRMARPLQGASPLRPPSAGPGASVGDDAVAADALVTLGLAAEAELEHQQQHGRPAAQQGYEVDPFARPAAKKPRLGGMHAAEQGSYNGVLQQQHAHPGVARVQQQWQYSSQAAAAAGQYGFGGLANGHAHITSPRQRAAQQGRLQGQGMGLPPWQQPQQRGPRQQQLQQPHQGRPGMDSEGPGEFLPWEQLVSGIRAIKTQGPPLFKPSGTRVPPHKQQNSQVDKSCASKFAGLLDLVGELQPDIQQTAQQRQQQLQQLLLQQQQAVLQHAQQAPILQAGRSGSWGGSSTSSSNSCQLPLFRAVNAQMSALLLQQQAQQLQQQGLLPSPHMQQMQPPPANLQQLPPQQQQQVRPAAPPIAPAAVAPGPAPAAAAAAAPQHAMAPPPVPAHVGAVAAALRTATAVQASTALQQQQPMERVPTAASFTQVRPQGLPQQQQQRQLEADCVRAGVPDADSRAAAAAAVQACCAGHALGSAGSGGSTLSADSTLAAAAAATMPTAMQTNAAAGIRDMRQVQAVAQ